MRRATLSRFAPALALLAAVMTSALATAADETDSIAAVAAATKAAVQWLDSLDAHRYAESWSGAATVMQAGHTQDEWIRDVATPREAFGKTLMRELESAEYSTRVRGAPEGNYVTAAYLTQFSNMPPVIESLVLMLQDGGWRIAGYSVAHAPETAAPSAPPGASGAAPESKPK
jgi:hypothetical protein